MDTRSLGASLAFFTIAIPSSALASSFQLLEQSPAHMGKAFSGTASDISDASTVYFNPAGMSRLDHSSLSLGANIVSTEANFVDEESTWPGESGSTNEYGFVPNAYFVLPLNGGFTIGFGAGGPFGLSSDYGDNWMGRYSATLSELEVMNFNVTSAWAPNDKVAFGLGLNYQRLDVTLENQVDSTLSINPDPSTDSGAKVNGDADDVVLDASVLVNLAPDTRLGFLWRQGGDFDVEGSATFSLNAACAPGEGLPTAAPPAPTTGTICANTLTALEGPITATADLPDTLTASLTHDLTDAWSVHADISQTRWSSIQNIAIMNADNQRTVDVLDLQYDDTLRTAIGASYQYSDEWQFRFGIAEDEAPQTDAEHVSPRIPDEDRTWMAVGANWSLSDDMSVDISYAHLMVDDAEIIDTDEDTGRQLNGYFENEVQIFAAQLNWRFSSL